jgi:hypothetical protein
MVLPAGPSAVVPAAVVAPLAPAATVAAEADPMEGMLRAGPKAIVPTHSLAFPCL